MSTKRAIVNFVRRRKRWGLFAVPLFAIVFLFNSLPPTSVVHHRGMDWNSRGNNIGSYFSHLFYWPDADIVISDVYKTIKFHERSIEPPIRQSSSKNPVEMIVMPHSHCDPGWIYTFKNYFDVYAQSILTNAAQYLEKNDKMRFIYAEISFVDLFFQHSDQKKRELFRKHVKNGHIEIVTGAWVQADEANSLVFSILMQMLEGHEWVQNHLGVIPENHWSIDPFGHSPVMAYLIKEAGFKNAVLNRVHYELLKKFGEEGDLEFNWRPNFARDSDRELYTSIMPYGHYDSARSCGPNFTVCCRLDFIKRGQKCYDEFGAKDIVDLKTPELVKEMAESLAEQVRKKRDLFKHDSVFLNIGEDFRYVSPLEFPAINDNFEQIFKYMEQNPELNVKGRFGTLKDYFDSVRSSSKDKIRSLAGDFFTYTDRDDHYWSGYFTSRPYFKQLDRTHHQFVRAADILFTTAMSSKVDETTLRKLFPSLVQARRDLSLFQHHDGVTGTAQPDVMRDYEKRMLDGITSAKTVIAQTTEKILNVQRLEAVESSSRLNVTAKSIVEAGNDILLFNPLAQLTSQVVCIRAKGQCPLAVHLIPTGQVPIQQCGKIYDAIDGKFLASSSESEICFLTQLDGLSFQKYRIDTSSSNNSTTVEITSDELKTSEVFQVENAQISASFTAKTGMLQFITNKFDSTTTPMAIEFRSFGSRPTGTRKTVGPDSVSGAYLFLPNGPSKPLNPKSSRFFVVKGPVRSSVYIEISDEYSLLQKVSLDTNAETVRVNNLIDLSKCKTNIEIAMQITTDSKLNKFYSDLNGFEMTRRERLESLPSQARFYPMPTSALLENEKHRVSILSRQPLGVGNEADGVVQIVLDRWLDQLDDRGLLSPLTDNVPAESEFLLLAETFYRSNVTVQEKQINAYHSLKAHYLLLNMHNPAIIMKGRLDDNRLPFSTLMTAELPCDVHLTILRTTAGPTKFEVDNLMTYNRTASMIVQRLGVERYLGIPDFCSKTPQTVDPSNILHDTPTSVDNMSLSSLYNYGRIKAGTLLKLKPMEIRNFRLTY
ncbi:Alpha-mannosidase [Aphelenchoides besseyi]|nr:Alpha-mannosidase [Aphelenchoides besseyi]KAI6232308.1 Alpha-mannosidase [Aphelenchoides besseyi]